MNFEELDHLLGRDDYRMHNRKSVATLLSMMPDNCYKIVVDHQPRELEKSAELKAVSYTHLR